MQCQSNANINANADAEMLMPRFPNGQKIVDNYRLLAFICSPEQNGREKKRISKMSYVCNRVLIRVLLGLVNQLNFPEHFPKKVYTYNKLVFFFFLVYVKFLFIQNVLWLIQPCSFFRNFP